MSCSGCGGSTPPPMFRNTPRKEEGYVGAAKNLYQAAVQQPFKLRWFKDGVKGLIKCLNLVQIYSDEDIQKNRDVCQGCEHSVKRDNGMLAPHAQCMGPDPEKNGAPCGCFITCKTMVGQCPLGKWTTTPLTLENKDLSV